MELDGQGIRLFFLCYLLFLDGTFRAKQDSADPTSVNIYLVKSLEYEKVNSYTLTLQVRNSPDLVAEAQLTGMEYIFLQNIKNLL